MKQPKSLQSKNYMDGILMKELHGSLHRLSKKELEETQKSITRPASFR